eukprot:91932-Hanusia_phi.AAC.1
MMRSRRTAGGGGMGRGMGVVMMMVGGETSEGGEEEEEEEERGLGLRSPVAAGSVQRELSWHPRNALTLLDGEHALEEKLTQGSKGRSRGGRREDQGETKHWE